jgi:hypothetical protein
MSLIMIVLGANAMLLQIASLREFMVVFSGNELDLGIMLPFWLLAVGIGTRGRTGMSGSSSFPRTSSSKHGLPRTFLTKG